MRVALSASKSSIGFSYFLLTKGGKAEMGLRAGNLLIGLKTGSCCLTSSTSGSFSLGLGASLTGDSTFYFCYTGGGIIGAYSTILVGN